MYERILVPLDGSDLAERAMPHRARNVAAESLMLRDFPRTTPTDSLIAAQDKLAVSGLRALPVVDEARRLTGLLTLADVGEAYRLLSVRPELSSALRWARPDRQSAGTSRPETEPATPAGNVDPVVEASWESFPASDPPAWTVGAHTGHGNGHAPHS